MVGFVQNIPSITGKSGTFTQHTVKCFHGVQVEKYGFEQSKETKGVLRFNQVTNVNNDVKVEDLLAKPADEPKQEAKPEKHHDQHGVGHKNKNGVRHSLIKNGSGHKKNHEIKGERAKKR